MICGQRRDIPRVCPNEDIVGKCGHTQGMSLQSLSICPFNSLLTTL